MSLTFGPRKVGVGITSPSQIRVYKVVNGVVLPDTVEFSDPVSVSNGSISFKVVQEGRYKIVASSVYSTESVIVDLLEHVPYSIML